MRPILISVTRQERAAPYARALEAAGVLPAAIEVIAAATAVGGTTERAAGAAGLLLAGGPDVAPERYGETKLEKLNNSVQVKERRDHVEWELLRGAETGRTPVLAICRGMQVANVYLGGSLYQDLSSQVQDLVEHAEPPHPEHRLMMLGPELPLSKLLGPDPKPVNSRHHQGIKDLGRGLLPAAESPDGVLEAVQLPPDGWWLWGVQWHPEDLLSLPEQFQLWQAFAAAARQRARAVAVSP